MILDLHSIAQRAADANAATQPNSGGLRESLTDKFIKLFPTWPMMVATLISLVFVVLILWYLAYKPVKKAIKARQDYIQSNIDQAKELNKQSETKLQEANLRLLEAQKEADKIVQDSRKESNKILFSYISLARNNSKRLLEEARNDVQKQKEEFLAQSKNEIANVASELSKKILQKSVDKEIEKEIIDNFLANEGTPKDV